MGSTRSRVDSVAGALSTTMISNSGYFNPKRASRHRVRSSGRSRVHTMMLMGMAGTSAASFRRRGKDASSALELSSRNGAVRHFHLNEALHET